MQVRCTWACSIANPNKLGPLGTILQSTNPRTTKITASLPYCALYKVGTNVSWLLYSKSRDLTHFLDRYNNVNKIWDWIWVKFGLNLKVFEVFLQKYLGSPCYLIVVSGGFFLLNKDTRRCFLWCLQVSTVSTVNVLWQGRIHRGDRCDPLNFEIP